MPKTPRGRDVFGDKIVIPKRTPDPITPLFDGRMPPTPTPEPLIGPLFQAQARGGRPNRGAGIGLPVDSDASNTVVATIDTAPVIGTALDYTPGVWTGSTAVSAQAMRCTTVDGTFVAVGTAWDADGGTPYTPVDGDFGYFFRVDETATPGDVAATGTANATACAETPVTTLGAQLLTNNDFSDGTGTFPNGWTYVSGTSGGDPGVSEVASGGGAGTGAAKFTSTATAASPSITQSVLVVGTYYEFSVVLSAFTSGQFQFRSSDGRITAGLGTITAAGTYRDIGRTSVTDLQFRTVTPPHDGTFDSTSIKSVTLNTQLTAPSANMRLDFFYTVPGTPRAGDNIWMMPRISDFATGNYWLAYLRYTGSQWDIILFSVATHTRTSRISATNIGTSNGIRVNMNGDSISLYTTADGGSNWTQRGTTISNATYNTATGVNALYLSSFTPGLLKYAPAD